MSKITLPTVTNGQNISTVNSNFAAIQDALNNHVLYRDNPSGEPNQMMQDLDMNGKSLLNIGSISAQTISLEDGTDLNTVVAQIEVDTSTALSNSTDAKADASSALSQSGSALSTANGLNSQIQTAVTQSTQAASDASTALSTANGIDAKATSALSQSGTALTNANAAVTTANGIASTANTALSQSATATSTANSAQTTANAALPKAGQTSGAAIPSGQIGEVLEVTSGSVALSNASPNGLAALSLPAGVWEVSATVSLSASGGATLQSSVGGINTAASIGPFGTYWMYGPQLGANSALVFPTPTYRYNFSTTTSVFVIAQTTFGSGSVAAIGKLHATRVA